MFYLLFLYKIFVTKKNYWDARKIVDKSSMKERKERKIYEPKLLSKFQVQS